MTPILRSRKSHLDSRDAIRHSNSSVEFAWRAHAAQESWTGKVDTKASILLALEGGMLFAVASTSAKGGVLSELSPLGKIVEICGIAALLVAIITSAAAVYPQLGPPQEHANRHADNFIYFGHLQHWHPPMLERSLKNQDGLDQLAALARQLVSMSKINWRKHRLVQVSIVFSILNLACFVTAATV
ncbi:Pycsar system effector family protein [Amycolatopsis marina]|uniref:Pycsar system effector family protein n=1 Tax=Amycolatopsis marina TaxID=490629 RepID=UPI0011608867|nr:Pycsar system effector family protein [Amycolatopsis marina]